MASSLVYEVCKDGPKGIKVLLRLNHDCLFAVSARVYHGYPTIACLLNKSPTLQRICLTATAMICTCRLPVHQLHAPYIQIHVYVSLVSRVDTITMFRHFAVIGVILGLVLQPHRTTTAESSCLRKYLNFTDIWPQCHFLRVPTLLYFTYASGESEGPIVRTGGC